MDWTQHLQMRTAGGGGRGVEVAVCRPCLEPRGKSKKRGRKISALKHAVPSTSPTTTSKLSFMRQWFICVYATCFALQTSPLQRKKKLLVENYIMYWKLTSSYTLLQGIPEHWNNLAIEYI